MFDTIIGRIIAVISFIDVALKIANSSKRKTVLMTDRYRVKIITFNMIANQNII